MWHDKIRIFYFIHELPYINYKNDAILKENPIDEICSHVQKFPNCPTGFEQALQKFVEELKEKEIIIEGDSVPFQAKTIPEEAASEGFSLEIDEFTEVSDLILADPVHDVEIEEEWPIFED